jgi:hypothetical protein
VGHLFGDFGSPSPTTFLPNSASKINYNASKIDSNATKIVFNASKIDSNATKLVSNASKLNFRFKIKT